MNHLDQKQKWTKNVTNSSKHLKTNKSNAKIE